MTCSWLFSKKMRECAPLRVRLSPRRRWEVRVQSDHSQPRTSEPLDCLACYVRRHTQLYMEDCSKCLLISIDLIQGVPVRRSALPCLNVYLTNPCFGRIVRTCLRYATTYTVGMRSHYISGSVPFLLREHLSYSQLGTFALAGYPYSLKLLWSPIVDSWFLPSIGRRKSWIIPMQLIIGTLMYFISQNVQALLDKVRWVQWTLSCKLTVVCPAC